MNLIKIIDILSSTEIFKDQSDSFLNIIAFNARKIDFKKGDLLVGSNEKEIKTIIILDGRTFIQKEQQNIELEQGSIIGLISLINKKPIPQSIIAGSRGVALIIDLALFDKIASQFPDFLISLRKKIKFNINKQAIELEDVFFNK